MINTSNPYGVGISNTPVLNQGSVEGQLADAARANRDSKAPLLLPEPIDKIMPILSTAIISMMQIKNMLNQAENNPIISKVNLETLHAKVDDINKELLDLPSYLYTITI